MNYLPMMTDQEIKYVCSVIPLHEIIAYFKQHPKEYGKILPGFRANSLKKPEQVSDLLYKKKNQHFISSFIEKHINRWLGDISDAIKRKVEEGSNKELALLQTLPYCYFVDNIGLYFKLTGEEYNEETFCMIENCIKLIKESISEQNLLQKTILEKSSAIEIANTEIDRLQNEGVKVKKILKEQSEEIKVLKRINTDLEKSKDTIYQLEQKIKELKENEKENYDNMQKLNTDLASAKNGQKVLEQKIDELTKQLLEKKQNISSETRPKCPKDIDEFQDFLGINFDNIGIPRDAEYFSLLKDHLSKVLFQGKPIIICRNTGFTLMRCVSNSLVNSSDVPTLVFSGTISEESIDCFLSQEKRLLCLDNFIGNFNETTLITISEKHRDKIIFLTVTYDHTLVYVPDELMQYCHYLNLNRIEGFLHGNELTEDPSSLDEDTTNSKASASDTRWSPLLGEILEEFGVSGALSAFKQTQISNEYELCCVLAFDVLPYCVDVMKKKPFSLSERFVKYAGDNGKCSYKALFRRWFS
jgi:hypothetical protein